MPGPVLVGVDGSGDEAAALGRMLAVLTGAPLALGAVYGYESSSPDWAPRDAAQAWLAAACRAPEERTHLILASSVAAGLDALAAREGAQILVLGSSTRGPLGRLLAGSTARRAIHGAPCAVAVAPRGWRPSGAPRTVLAAVDDGPEAVGAVAAAAQLATAAGARLRAVNVLHQPSPAHPMFSVIDTSYGEWCAARRAACERIVRDAALAAGAEPEIVIAEGDPVSRLAELSRTADLLVTGSRRYGPLRAVLLGGVSWPLLERAACPVLIVPRGAQAVRRRSVAAPSASASSVAPASTATSSRPAAPSGPAAARSSAS
jgi:nucleotide-binding universal stress UspA family protein